MSKENKRLNDKLKEQGKLIDSLKSRITGMKIYIKNSYY
jgi:hypothetical protein